MRTRRLAMLWLALATAGAAQTTAARLTTYNARVEFHNSSTAEVAIVLKLSGAPRQALSLLMLRYPEQSIEALKITDEHGQELFASMEEQLQALVLRTSPSAQEVHLVYSVKTEGTLRRIPLAVPNLSPSPQLRAGHISVNLPADNIAVGSGFPALAWHGTTGTADVAAIPSAVLVDFAPERGVTFVDRLTTPETLSTSAMAALLLIGTGFWIARQRATKPAEAKR